MTELKQPEEEISLADEWKRTEQMKRALWGNAETIRSDREKEQKRSLLLILHNPVDWVFLKNTSGDVGGGFRVAQGWPTGFNHTILVSICERKLIFFVSFGH